MAEAPQASPPLESVPASTLLYSPPCLWRRAFSFATYDRYCSRNVSHRFDFSAVFYYRFSGQQWRPPPNCYACWHGQRALYGQNSRSVIRRARPSARDRSEIEIASRPAMGLHANIPRGGNYEPLVTRATCYFSRAVSGSGDRLGLRRRRSETLEPQTRDTGNRKGFRNRLRLSVERFGFLRIPPVSITGYPVTDRSCVPNNRRLPTKPKTPVNSN